MERNFSMTKDIKSLWAFENSILPGTFHYFSVDFAVLSTSTINFPTKFHNFLILFTSLWSSFSSFLGDFFFLAHKIFLFPNFDRKLIRKQLFLNGYSAKLASSDNLVWKMYNLAVFQDFSWIKTFLTKIVHFFTTPADCSSDNGKFFWREWKNILMTSFSSGFLPTQQRKLPSSTQLKKASWQFTNTNLRAEKSGKSFHRSIALHHRTIYIVIIDISCKIKKAIS